MGTMKLHVLKPSVNNLPVRIFVRAAGLDAEEVDVWATTTSPEFLQKNPVQRAMVDSAMFYLIGTLYPLVARAKSQAAVA